MQQAIKSLKFSEGLATGLGNRLPSKSLQLATGFGQPLVWQFPPPPRWQLGPIHYTILPLLGNWYSCLSPLQKTLSQWQLQNWVTATYAI